MEKWYCKLNLAQPVQKRTDSKSRSHLWKNSPRLDWLSQIKLTIPLFHPEFDALQLLFDGLVKIPPFGNIGDFAIWLFMAILAISRQDLIRSFQNWPHFEAYYIEVSTSTDLNQHKPT